MTSQYSTESRGSEARLLSDATDEGPESPQSLPYSDKPFHSHSDSSRLCSSSSTVIPQISEYSNKDHLNGKSGATCLPNGQSKELPSRNAPVSIASAPPDEDVDFTFPNYTDQVHGAPATFDQTRAGGHVIIENEGNVKEMSPRGHHTPSVGYMCPPPAYGDHHKDKVLH